MGSTREPRILLPPWLLGVLIVANLAPYAWPGNRFDAEIAMGLTLVGALVVYVVRPAPRIADLPLIVYLLVTIVNLSLGARDISYPLLLAALLPSSLFLALALIGRIRGHLNVPWASIFCGMLVIFGIQLTFRLTYGGGFDYHTGPLLNGAWGNRGWSLLLMMVAVIILSEKRYPEWVRILSPTLALGIFFLSDEKTAMLFLLMGGVLTVATLPDRWWFKSAVLLSGLLNLALLWWGPGPTINAANTTVLRRFQFDASDSEGAAGTTGDAMDAAKAGDAMDLSGRVATLFSEPVKFGGWLPSSGQTWDSTLLGVFQNFGPISGVVWVTLVFVSSLLLAGLRCRGHNKGVPRALVPLAFVALGIWVDWYYAEITAFVLVFCAVLWARVQEVNQRSGQEVNERNCASRRLSELLQGR